MASADLIHVVGRVVLLLFYMKFHALEWKQGGGCPSAHPLWHAHVMFMGGEEKFFWGSIHPSTSFNFILSVVCEWFVASSLLSFGLLLCCDPCLLLVCVLYRFLSSSHLGIKAMSFSGCYLFFLFGVLHHTLSAEKWVVAVQILHCVQFQQRGVEKWGRCVVCTRWTSPPLL